MTELARNTEVSAPLALNPCREIIKELMFQHRINATELARRIQLPQPTIHRLLMGKTEDPKLSTLMLIANYFSISLDQLLGMAPLMTASHHATHTMSVPVISWQAAINANEKKISLKEHHECFTIDLSASNKTFALKTKKSMEPRFPTGSLLIVDPNVTAEDGDLVIVHYKKTQEATLRELVQDGPKQELRSILAHDHVDELKNGITLIGVVIQTRFTYDRKT